MSRVKKELKPCEMINLPMVPFFTKFPEIAAVETRSLIIAKNKKIPRGIYGLLESYCDELNCDCRRVFINVVSQGLPAEILATISYGWETPESASCNWMLAIRICKRFFRFISSSNKGYEICGEARSTLFSI